MASASPAQRRNSATVRPARRAAAAPAPLRVVRPGERTHAVGATGTIVVLLAFVIMFTLAGLHAMAVQTQAQVDATRQDIAQMVEQRNRLTADLSWLDSPEGIEESARAAGLVQAGDFEMLGRVPAGELEPPQGDNPFAGVTS